MKSERERARFQTDVVPATGPVAHLHLADRERDKLRLKLDWEPLEQDERQNVTFVGVSVR